MTTSEVRRGPGWWMDVEGLWNPPEAWPEDTPPLPGWTRNSDGTWYDPAPEAEPVSDGDTPESTSVISYAGPPATDTAVATPSPEPSLSVAPRKTSVGPLPPAVGTNKANEVGRSSLTFAENVAPDPSATRGSKPAVNAALLAALITIMLAAGLIILLTV